MLFATSASGTPPYRAIMTGLGASSLLAEVSAAPAFAGGASIPLLNISDRSASLATGVSESASPASSSNSPFSIPAYNSASRFRSRCSSICPITSASYARQRCSSYFFQVVAALVRYLPARRASRIDHIAALRSS